MSSRHVSREPKVRIGTNCSQLLKMTLFKSKNEDWIRDGGTPTAMTVHQSPTSAGCMDLSKGTASKVATSSTTCVPRLVAVACTGDNPNIIRGQLDVKDQIFDL